MSLNISLIRDGYCDVIGLPKRLIFNFSCVLFQIQRISTLMLRPLSLTSCVSIHLLLCITILKMCIKCPIEVGAFLSNKMMETDLTKNPLMCNNKLTWLCFNRWCDWITEITRGPIASHSSSNVGLVVLKRHPVIEWFGLIPSQKDLTWLRTQKPAKWERYHDSVYWDT